MGLKYKKMDLELPPLGEVIVGKTTTEQQKKKTPLWFFTNNDKIDIGFFYVNKEGKKYFHSLCCVLGDGLPSIPGLWASLPEFISINDLRPHIGREFILHANERIDRGVKGKYMRFETFVAINGSEIKFDIENYQEGINYYWLSVEAFDEE